MRPLRLIGALLGALAVSAGVSAPADPAAPATPFVLVLGVAQDAGYPQTACRKACCAPAQTDPSANRNVASLAIVDPESGRRWLIDATPDFREQLRTLDEAAPPPADDRSSPALAGIFCTHAHIGHYLGLAQLGREATGARGVPVYAMPRMRSFLENNGPWSQLVGLGNIELRDLHNGEPVWLTGALTVTPLLVPHRDEYSETVGFRVEGPGRSVLYVPDIDKWSRWERRIEDEIAKVDVAYLDGTFYADGELPGRDMSEIPHPFIKETMERLAELPQAERAKVRFIHFNHTNPVVRGDSKAIGVVEGAGFGVAREGERVELQ
ncbi:MAG: pyrroloquinoline quinone biosynthesis protein PqqB [Phycisphaeraceae bacterium]|nr:pyrroloquinoline quinone biosynthesis protein PqqB [Phycisphaeraceae bacterium]MCB9847727.1 pyrroloquinoline quinone biosynthesis protein PqqB [Phycisphaeraceae bacterium]